MNTVQAAAHAYARLGPECAACLVRRMIEIRLCLKREQGILEVTSSDVFLITKEGIESENLYSQPRYPRQNTSFIPPGKSIPGLR